MSGPRTAVERRQVLVLGVYLADRENLAEDIATELGRSRRWEVEQRWVAIGKAEVPPALAPFTRRRVPSPLPKFVLLNGLLAEADVGRYEFVVFTDDDIRLPMGFLDTYLELVGRHGLALAQPARTHQSYIDHPFVEQLDGIDARWTRFVEIGPLFSVRRDALGLLAPFDESSAMGWGYDFAWPVVMERAGLRMGVIDATPVDHNLRKPVANYSYDEANRAMKAYLARRPHLQRSEAFSIIEAYAPAGERR